MRAVVHDRYGGPEALALREVPTPEPGTHQIRVRVHATTVNRTDTGFLRGEPGIVRLFAGLRRPRARYRVLGTEFAGEVDAVGSDVTDFAVGDRVFGVNSDRFGAHAEYVCVGDDRPVAMLPDAIGFDEGAAAGDGAILALAYLRATAVGPGTRVLVFGASGAIGSAAVQLAKHLGAHVTAVSLAPGVDAVRALAPDEVIDASREQFTERGEAWDVVFDAVGKSSFRRCRPALVKGGIYTSTDFGPWHQNPVLALRTRLIGAKKVRFPLPRYTQADVRLLADLMAEGAFRPVVDRVLPLDEVAEATRYVETQQKIGNVILVVDPQQSAP